MHELFPLKCKQACPTRRSELTNLSICKDGGVVALKAPLNESLSTVGVDSFLLSVHVKNMIKGEGLVLAEDHLRFSGHHICAYVTAFDLFFSQLRTDPTKDRDTTII